MTQPASNEPAYDPDQAAAAAAYVDLMTLWDTKQHGAVSDLMYQRNEARHERADHDQ
jgi:hypothetical protein